MDNPRVELATIEDELATYETVGFKHLQENLSTQVSDLTKTLTDNTKLPIEEVRLRQGQLKSLTWLLERPDELAERRRQLIEQLRGPQDG